MTLFLPLLVLWNVWLLVFWGAQFHIKPAHLVDAFYQYFVLQADFSWAVLAENWLQLSVGLLSLAGTLGLARQGGRQLARLLNKSWRSGEELLLPLAFGLGLLGSAMLGLGLTGLLLTPPRSASLALLAMLGGFEIRHLWRSFSLQRNPEGWLTGLSPVTRIALVLGFLVTAVGVLNIEMAWDALTYHLRLPTFYAYRHKIFDVWHHQWSYFPAQIEMLFAFGQIVQGDLLARLLNAVCGILLLLSTHDLAKRIGIAGKWPVLLIAASPVFLILSTRCYIDLGFAFFLTLSLSYFLRWWERGSRAALAASGILAGWGLGSKYIGALFLVALLAAAWPRLSQARGWRAAAWWNGLAFLPFSPWLIKNWLYVKNPFFPFLSGTFGKPTAIPDEMHLSLYDLSGGLPALVHSLATRAEALFMEHGHVDGPLLPVIAGLFPLLAWGTFRGARAVLWRAVLAYTGVWLALHPDTRFYLPILPALVVLLTSELLTLRERGRHWRVGLRMMLEASLIAGVVYSASLQWVFFAPFSMVLGLETTQTKLQLGLPPPPFTFYMKEYVNRHVPKGDRILYACHFSTYYVERECLADFHYDQAHLTRLVKEAGTAEKLALTLKRLGIKWILSTGVHAAQYRHIPGFFDLTDRQWAEFKRFLATRAEAVWQTEGYTLYRIGLPHPPRPLPVLPVYGPLAFVDADQALSDGRIDEALNIYTNPPPLLRNVGSTYLRQGDAYLARGNIKRGEQAFLHAQKLGVDTPRLHAGLALARLWLGRPQEGLGHAETAWRQNPLSAKTAATLALLYSAVGRDLDARRLIQEARHLRPDVEEYHRLAAQLGVK